MSFNALARSNTSPSGDWSSPGLAAPEDEFAPKFFNTASGVKVQQLSEGTGAKVHRGDTVLLDYVLRRANGYFIYSTVEGVSFQPKDIPIGPVVITLVGIYINLVHLWSVIFVAACRWGATTLVKSGKGYS